MPPHAGGPTPHQPHPPYTPPATPTSGGPPPHYPPAPPGWQPPPPRKKSFWGSAGGILTIIFGSGLILALICGGLITMGQASDREALKNIKVTLNSCEGNDLIGSATVGYTVTNNGSESRRVKLEIEYRDSSGARLDTDTAYVGEVPAGDTVRGDETTILNGQPSGSITCKIVGVS